MTQSTWTKRRFPGVRYLTREDLVASRRRGFAEIENQLQRKATK